MPGGQRSETVLRSTGTHTLNRRSEIRDRAEEKHRDTQAGWDFMAEDQKSETELRRSTGTHTLNRISWQEVRDQRQS